MERGLERLNTILPAKRLGQEIAVWCAKVCRPGATWSGRDMVSPAPGAESTSLQLLLHQRLRAGERPTLGLHPAVAIASYNTERTSPPSTRMVVPVM
jgi:hypothetical protein